MWALERLGALELAWHSRETKFALDRKPKNMHVKSQHSSS